MSTIEVVIDDRARLVTAVLAASDWPAEEQKTIAHAVHPHAKQTRQFVKDSKHHAAVRGVNQALLNGVTLPELFSTAVRCEWPTFEPSETLPRLLKIERWARSLADFEHDTEIAQTFWPAHHDVWQTAVSALTGIFQDGTTANFLAKVTKEPLTQKLAVMPNLVYPALEPVLATNQETLLLLLPPPKAVGESPPWPYDEDPPWVVASVCQNFATHLMAKQLAGLEETQRTLIHHATTALCLAAAFDEFEAQAYLLRMKKEHNLPELPHVTEQLRLYMAADLANLADVFA